MRTSLRFLAAAACVAPLVACEAVDSSSVLTDGMWAEMTAVSDGDNTTATATLKVGGPASNTFVELVGDDSLTVAIDGAEPTELDANNLGDWFWYDTTTDLVAAGTSFDFAFLRSVDEGAPSTTCSLPSPFEISAPAEDTEFSRANDAMTVTWDGNTSDSMEVIVSSDCFVDLYIDVEGDPGTVVVEAGSYDVYEDDEAENCPATVTVKRIAAGTVDTGFGEGGESYGVQVRSVDVMLLP
jgi:hypothetical protein